MIVGDRFLCFVYIWFLFFYVINLIVFLFLVIFRDWKIVLFILLVFLLVDIGGFFGGKFFGKKLIKVSFVLNILLKKIWEGFIVGVIVCWIFVVGMIFGLGLMENKVIL